MRARKEMPRSTIAPDVSLSHPAPSEPCQQLLQAPELQSYLHYARNQAFNLLIRDDHTIEATQENYVAHRRA